MSLNHYKPMNHDLLYIIVQLLPIMYVYNIIYTISSILLILILFIQVYLFYYIYNIYTKQLLKSKINIVPSIKSSPINNTRRLSIFNKIEFSNFNPFVSLNNDIDKNEIYRLAFMGSIFVPFRSLIIFISLLFVFIISCIVTFGYDPKSGPLSYWRRLVLVPTVKIGARIMLFGYGYYYIPYWGKPANSNDAPIVIGNHICMIDPIIMVMTYIPAPVGAREHMAVPLLGTIMKALQLIMVDRSDPDSRSKVQHSILNRTGKPEWPQTLIFPEATCTNGTSLVQFKVGPFAPGKPIQPVIFKYHAGEGGRPHFHPGWVTAGPSGGEIAFRLLCEPINWVSVEYLDVYKPSAEEIKDVKLYARNVREVMAAKLNIPIAKHSYEDVQLQNDALKNRLLPPEMAVLEIEKVISALNIKVDDCKCLLRKFHEIDTAGLGKVNYEQFAQGLGFTPGNEFIRHLCELIDNDDSGFIDFREYVVGLGILSSTLDADREETVHLAFRMFDVNESGKIPVKLLKDMFSKFITHATVEDEDKAFESLKQYEEVDFNTFKKFALQDPRYLTIFRQALIPSKA